MRRRWNRMLLAALIASIAFLYPLLAPTPHRIDPGHFELIVAGMTKEQVEAIFGVPAGQYDWAEDDSQPRLHFYFRLRQVEYMLLAANSEYRNDTTHATFRGRAAGPQSEVTWTSRHGSLYAWLDDDDRVVSTHVSTQVRVTPPWQRWWNQYWKK